MHYDKKSGDWIRYTPCNHTILELRCQGVGDHIGWHWAYKECGTLYELNPIHPCVLGTVFYRVTLPDDASYVGPTAKYKDHWRNYGIIEKDLERLILLEASTRQVNFSNWEINESDNLFEVVNQDKKILVHTTDEDFQVCSYKGVKHFDSAELAFGQLILWLEEENF